MDGQDAHMGGGAPSSSTAATAAAVWRSKRPRGQYDDAAQLQDDDMGALSLGGPERIALPSILYVVDYGCWEAMVEQMPIGYALTLPEAQAVAVRALCALDSATYFTSRPAPTLAALQAEPRLACDYWPQGDHVACGLYHLPHDEPPTTLAAPLAHVPLLWWYGLGFIAHRVARI